MVAKYLTSDEVSEWLSIEKTYLYRLINERQFPTIRLGSRTLRFDETEVIKWLEKRKKGFEQ